MSTSGFLVFTDRTQGNILNNFAEDDLLINVARACVRTFFSVITLSQSELIVFGVEIVWLQHVRNFTTRSVCLSGSRRNVFLARRERVQQETTRPHYQWIGL